MINIELNDYINKHATGYVIKATNLNNKPYEVNTYVTGNAEIFPNTIKMTEKHLFDIASLTKVFTAICIFRAVEKKLLRLEEIIKDIDDRFINLDNVSILDLLAHRVEIWTDGYLGDAISKEDFYKRLLNSKVKKYHRCYVDAHYMILSTILEKIYKLSFDKIIEQEIVVPLELKNTTFNPEKFKDIVSNNYGLVGDKMVEDAYPGITHDTKARVAKKYGIYVGHAGVFTTAEDLFKVLVSFVDDKEILLKKETINKMISHDNINEELFNSMMQYANQNNIRVTSININNIYEEILDKCSNPDDFFEYVFRSYNYMGTRFKNPIKAKNDVPEMASDNTIVFSGYTGPGFLIDFDRKIVILVMCNVCHMSKLRREERKKMSLEIMTKIYNDM